MSFAVSGGDGGTCESQQPVLGPDHLTFWRSAVPRSSYTQISDPRSIALPIAVAYLPLVACE
jgi:hypothetical protein